MQSLPAAARRVNQWVKKRVTLNEFTTFYLPKLQSFFLHHQIEQVFLPPLHILLASRVSFLLVVYVRNAQAQHDAFKIFIQFVQSNSYVATFSFDFAENYGHIAQVNSNVHYVCFAIVCYISTLCYSSNHR